VLLPELQEATRNLNGQGFTCRVVVVLSGLESDAECVPLIQNLNFECIRRSPTNSFGDAIRSGFHYVASDSDLVVTMDADGSHSPRTISKLLEQANQADVVVASRYVFGGSSANPLHLKLMSRLLNLVFRLLMGIKCSDLSTNFKVYHGNDIMNISLSCENFDVIEELLVKIRRRHKDDFKIVEVPDHFDERKFGKTKRKLGVFIVGYILTLIRLRVGRESN
jgi:dolichol-phosphate mannosyltransferase